MINEKDLYEILEIEVLNGKCKIKISKEARYLPENEYKKVLNSAFEKGWYAVIKKLKEDGKNECEKSY